MNEFWEEGKQSVEKLCHKHERIGSDQRMFYLC